MPVIKDQITASGGIMPDHACDRGAVRLDPEVVPHPHRHINQSRMPAGYEGRAQIASFFAPFQAVTKAALTAPKADIHDSR